ncbi:MAG: bifunctional DNA-binding transcriptional regulator/O6-methylguanine-DNA methyltransferase Ada [Gemmatimonadales bacterium]
MTTAERWNIVQRRDRRYDAAFVYAVRSTGIYCRPSCASRRPRREQVTFFPIPEAAERAGFRPCRRCRPTHVNGVDPAVALVREACRALAAPEPPPLERLAATLGTAPHRLVRAFKRVLGVTPSEYRATGRLARFKHELRRRKSVSPALYEAGYSSPSRIYERADAQLGMTPATYARGGRGAEIAYAIVPSPAPFGRLLVAATARGICRIAMGEDAARLEAELAQEFPAARLHRDRAALERWVTRLVRHLEGREPDLDLPLDIQATAFQRRVWRELQRIPRGTTRSYAEVARRIGQPQAIRAVARACAMNPVALAIPCHRVVSKGGELGGYRWGIERKRALLEREKMPEVDAQRPRG